MSTRFFTSAFHFVQSTPRVGGGDGSPLPSAACARVRRQGHGSVALVRRARAPSPTTTGKALPKRAPASPAAVRAFVRKRAEEFLGVGSEEHVSRSLRTLVRAQTRALERSLDRETDDRLGADAASEDEVEFAGRRVSSSSRRRARAPVPGRDPGRPCSGVGCCCAGAQRVPVQRGLAAARRARRGGAARPDHESPENGDAARTAALAARRRSRRGLRRG